MVSLFALVVKKLLDAILSTLDITIVREKVTPKDK